MFNCWLKLEQILFENISHVFKYEIFGQIIFKIIQNKWWLAKSFIYHFKFIQNEQWLVKTNVKHVAQ